MLLFQTFAELTPKSVDEDPLIMLGCGHAFTMTTLDGIMEMDRCSWQW